MEINSYGQVTLSEDEAVQVIYSTKTQDLGRFFFEESVVSQFNHALNKNKDNIACIRSIQSNSLTMEEFDLHNQGHWFMPKNYCPNLIEMLYQSCDTEEKRNRVEKELKLFTQHKMYDLLYYLKYLVDTMRENNIVWGVGRGSCVASYVLYLIGVHKIDSLKYQLDINEFLKELKNE